MAKRCWFHTWEWDGYSLRRCVGCQVREEKVQFGYFHSPSSEWRETVEAFDHFAEIDKRRG